MLGATIHAPCVNHSAHLSDLSGTDLWLGFIHIKGFSQQHVQRILLERRRAGVFRDLTDFCHRVECESSQLKLLIRVGAFRFTGLTKAQLLEEKETIYSPWQRRGAGAPDLFTSATEADFGSGDAPNYRPGHPLSATELDQAFDELELLGFPLCSPFLLSTESTRKCDYRVGAQRDREMYARVPKVSVAEFSPLDRTTRKDGALPVSRVPPHPLAHIPDGKTTELLGYFVCDKIVPTVKGQRMSFGCWLNEAGHYFDSVHFPDVYRKFPFCGRGVYRLRGVVSREFDFPTLEVRRMERIPNLQDRRYPEYV
jgi:DNA polymerase-3 subunit alpha